MSFDDDERHSENPLLNVVYVVVFMFPCKLGFIISNKNTKLSLLWILMTPFPVLSRRKGPKINVLLQRKFTEIPKVLSEYSTVHDAKSNPFHQFVIPLVMSSLKRPRDETRNRSSRVRRSLSREIWLVGIVMAYEQKREFSYKAKRFHGAFECDCDVESPPTT